MSHLYIPYLLGRLIRTKPTCLLTSLKEQVSIDCNLSPDFVAACPLLFFHRRLKDTHLTPHFASQTLGYLLNRPAVRTGYLPPNS